MVYAILLICVHTHTRMRGVPQKWQRFTFPILELAAHRVRESSYLTALNYRILRLSFSLSLSLSHKKGLSPNQLDDLLKFPSSEKLSNAAASNTHILSSPRSVPFRLLFVCDGIISEIIRRGNAHGLKEIKQRVPAAFLSKIVRVSARSSVLF